jgi:hypothetical protein
LQAVTSGSSFFIFIAKVERMMIVGPAAGYRHGHRLDSLIAKFDLLLQVPGKQTAVLFLQILLLPILARDDSPACGAAAQTRDRIDRVIGGGPIVGQFLAGRDFA